MKRGKFLKLLGMGAAAIPAAKILGLPKDADGFYINTPAIPPAATPPVLQEPMDFLNIADKNLYVGLFTNEPANVSGVVDFKEYGRVAVPRSKEGWNIQIPKNRYFPAHVENAKRITFPECTTDRQTILEGFKIMDEKGRVIWDGKLATPLSVSKGITPEFEAGDLIIEMD